MKVDKWYKSIVESNTEAPPEAVWEGIQDALDVDLVWGKIETDLNVRKKKPNYARLAVAASIVLAIAFGGVLLYQPWNISSQSQLVESSGHFDAPSSTGLIYPSDDGAEISPQTQGATTSQLAKVSQSTQLDAEAVDVYLQSPSSSVDEQAENVLERIKMHTAGEMPVSAPGKVSTIAIAQLPAEQGGDYDNNTSIRTVYVGLTGHLANTWLLSSKTFAGLQPDDLTNTNITFGSNFGMQLGTAITPVFKIQSDFLWISQNKQQYNEYINGKYVTSALELDYYTLALQGKYSFPTNHTVIFGGYFGLMKTAKQSVEEEIILLDDDYSSYDYGLIVGYEYPIPLGHRLTLTPGLFAKVGLNNVFAGNDYIPFYLNKTQNASINLSLSIAYNIF